MIFNNITNFFGNFWTLATDFLTFIFLFIFMVLFFIVQYYIVKGYIYLGKAIYGVLEHYGFVGKIKAYVKPETAKEE